MLSIITLGIFGLVYMGLKHGQLPKVKSNDPGAGKAIGFWFIPFFHYYWIFVFWLRLVDRINFQYRLRGAPAPVSRNFAIWTNAVYLSGILLGVTYLVAVIMWFVLIAQQQSVQKAGATSNEYWAVSSAVLPDPSGTPDKASMLLAMQGQRGANAQDLKFITATVRADFEKSHDGHWRVANLTVLKKPQMNQGGQ